MMRNPDSNPIQPGPSCHLRPPQQGVRHFDGSPHAWVDWIAMMVVLLALMSIGHVTAIAFSKWPEQHDVDAHVEYSQLVAKNHALPHPRAGWITYHPPLFYLFTQPFKPLQDTRRVFIDNVRWANAFLFGTLFLFCFLGVAHALRLREMPTLLVVGFLVTTPSVVQLFTSFNNDPMATGFTSLMALAALKFYQADRRGAAVAWGILVVVAGVLALYAKFTSLFALLALAMFLAIGLATRRLKPRAFGLAGMVALCLLALLPYLFFHNYRSTGSFFPHNVEKATDMAFSSMDLHGGRLRFLLTPPLLTDGEWSTPYATGDGQEDMWWPKKNILASAFVTSLYGEWDFNQRGRPKGAFILPKNTWAWLGVWTHLLFLPLALASRSSTARSALLLAALIFCSHVAHVMAVMPFYNAANFRYYAWILLPIAVAATVALERKVRRRGRASVAPIAVLGLGTLIHLGFVVSAL
jgi:hypothetical protein